MPTYCNPVQLRLTPELRAELRAEAEMSERSVSQLIRLAIREHLERSRESIRAN